MLAHRPDVLNMRRGTQSVIRYLQAASRRNTSATDALWSMMHGPHSGMVPASLWTNRHNREAVVRHIVRDLESMDEERIERTLRFLASNARYRRPATPAITKMVEELFADEKRDTSNIKALTKSKDRATKAWAIAFLKIYPDVDVLLTAHQKAIARVENRSKTERSQVLVGMLDVDSLRPTSIGQLSEIGTPAIPTLKIALADENNLIAEGAVQALTEMKDASVPDILAGVLIDKTRTTGARIRSLQFLAASMDGKPAWFELIQRQSNETQPTELRIAAIGELAKSKKHRHEVVNLLEKILRTESVAVAEYATTTLGVMAQKENQRIIMVLTRQLQSPHARIQRAAIFALVGKGARVHFERMQKKPDLDPMVKTALEVALSTRKKVLVGFLVADYSDNRILQIDLKGNTVSSIEEIFGVWDAEILDNGNYLITEFSVNRVSEVTPDNKTVWSFWNLKNPYDADRLRNGNTLIADTFGRRVIEVDRAGKIVWKYDTDIHPYDVDRLQNGNTLIADTYDDRVIEVDPTGRIVWSIKNVPNVHDADRLPNGNTLLTIRMLNEVREVDAAGRTVLRLQNLSSPSDADRLPDGRTIVAENGFLRIFDTTGKAVWSKRITWAVEVNPVWKYQRDAQKRAGGK
jgi:HEAT repeat protein